MSVTTAGAFGTRDLPIPANVRIYHLASTHHLGYPFDGPLTPARRPACQQLPNANSYAPAMRALLVALTAWVRNGTPPPPSRYARLADRTLVRPEQLHFPAIPGVSENVTVLLDRGAVWDRGPSFDARNLSGVIGSEPPLRTAEYLALVPQVDADGNDLDGIRSTSIQAPVGTYTGWNTRAAGFSEGDACDIFGSFIPFARTAAERAASGDARLSLEERYGDHAGYVAAVAAAARRLAADGFLLADDVAATIRQAEASDVLK
jgi:Alpha/beta hydrolase domain